MVLNASVSFVIIIFRSDRNSLLPWWLSFSLDFVFLDLRNNGEKITFFAGHHFRFLKH